jgi:hypothetical protein
MQEMKVGAFIVYESVFSGRWVVREIVGETRALWIIRRIFPDGEMVVGKREYRRRKDSREFALVCATEENAFALARDLTETHTDLIEAHKTAVSDMMEAAKTSSYVTGDQDAS